MPGQIVNVSNNEAISEVSLKCGDIYFKDFPKNIYSQAVYRAERSIAKDFGVMDRIWSYTNTAGTSPISITPLNFNGQWRVTITPEDGEETVYKQVQLEEVIDENDTTVNYYAIIFNTNEFVLYYTNPAENDLVQIYYISSIAGEEDYETLDAEGNAQAIPALPNRFFEEVVRRAVRYMAQLGIANFSADKRDKYISILKIYTRADDELKEQHLEKTRPFIKIKPFIYP